MLGLLKYWKLGGWMLVMMDFNRGNTGDKWSKALLLDSTSKVGINLMMKENFSTANQQWSKWMAQCHASGWTISFFSFYDSGSALYRIYSMPICFLPVPFRSFRAASSLIISFYIMIIFFLIRFFFAHHPQAPLSKRHSRLGYRRCLPPYSFNAPT